MIVQLCGNPLCSGPKAAKLSKPPSVGKDVRLPRVGKIAGKLFPMTWKKCAPYIYGMERHVPWCWGQAATCVAIVVYVSAL